MVGIDHFVTSFQAYKNVPIGILTNHATFSSSGYPSAYELLRQGFRVTKLFSPEHGVHSQGEDGKAQVSGQDSLTQLPLVSLYGRKLRPEETDLKDLDLVLIDLPNIGCRFYTYWWTVTHMVEACAQARKKVMLLDRPNMSGRKPDEMEGPLLDDIKCSSFIGRWRMPLSYSYSYGQLMRWFVAERKIALSFEVIPFDWEHAASNEPFIPPSPAMNGLQAALMYPCTGLFEGLNLNTGRGTAFPFRVIGAPWIDSMRLYEDFSAQQFPGIKVFPYSYQPSWSLYAGDFCNGLYFQIEDSTVFRPVHTGLWLMNYLSLRYPERLRPATYPTAANPTGENHLDFLLGIHDSYTSICSGSQISISQIKGLLDVSVWTRTVDSFLAKARSDF